MTALKPRAGRTVVSEVFEDLQPLVRRIARRFAARFGLDFQETEADANVIFLHAYHTHDAHRSSLEQRLQFVIPKRLMDAYRDKLEAAQRLPCVGLPADWEAVGREPAVSQYDEDEPLTEADLIDPWDPQESDARFVAALVVEPPDALLDAIRAVPKASTRAVRDCVRAHLTALGWDRRRVRRAFRTVWEYQE